MSFDWQDIIVCAVVLAAISFALRRIMRRTQSDNPCDGCTGCDQGNKNSCNTPEKEER